MLSVPPAAPQPSAPDASPIHAVPPGGGQLSCLQRVSLAVDSSLTNAFGTLTDVITAHPVKVKLLCALLSAVLASGFARYREENEGTRLWTPQNTKARDDKIWIESVFGFEDRQVTLYAEGQRGQNMLDKAALLSFLGFWDTVRAFATTLDGETLTYNKLCVKDHAACRPPRSVLALWNYSAARLAADPDVLATLNSPTAALPPGGPPLEWYLGHPRREGGRVVGCEALRLVTALENNVVYTAEKGETDTRADTWEYELGKAHNGKSGSGFQFHMYSRGLLEMSAKATLAGDIVVLPIGYVLTVVFVCIVMWRKRRARSHIALGLVSIIGVGMATVSAIGLALHLGVKYNPVVSVLVLVLLGIGVDDTFVIYDAWYVHEHPEDGAPPEEGKDVRARVRRAMQDAGPSITTTSVTDMVAFAAGTATELPALRDFCIYACFGIGFDFLYQVTFVVAFLYIDGCREAGQCCGTAGAPRADVCCCSKVNDSTGCCGMKIAGSPDKDKRWMQTLLGDYLPKALYTRVGAALVVAVTLVLLVVGSIGLANLDTDFDFEWFIAKDDSLQGTFEVRDRHFGSNNLPVYFYTAESGYHLAEVQREFIALHEAIRRDPWVIGDSLGSWYMAYRAVRGVPADAVVPSQGFYTNLRAFLATPVGLQFNASIRWGGPDRIVGTRLYALYEGAAMESGLASVDAMQSARRSIQPWAASLGARAYSSAFLFFEGLAVIQWEVLRNVIIAACCVFAICLLLLANIPAAVAVLLAVAMIDIDLLGFTHWIGYDYNSVTCINAVLAIGLSVDYTAHVVRAFLSHAGRRRDRATFALREIGSAVVNGGLSTFVAILPLSMAKSYVFQVFFAMFALIIVLGLFHGVIATPAVLRWLGPAPYPGAPVCPSTYEDGDTVSPGARINVVAVPAPRSAWVTRTS